MFKFRSYYSVDSENYRDLKRLWSYLTRDKKRNTPEELEDVPMQLQACTHENCV